MNPLGRLGLQVALIVNRVILLQKPCAEFRLYDFYCSTSNIKVIRIFIVHCYERDYLMGKNFNLGVLVLVQPCKDWLTIPLFCASAASISWSAYCA